MNITVKLPLFLTIFASCNGLTKTNQTVSEIQDSTIEIGTVVDSLGEHLWCVFQDSKNNYWFGSDGEGVYRYDGKTIVNFTTEDGLSGNRIRQIQEDKHGNLYFSTLEGIHKFDGKKITSLTPIKSKEWKLEENDLWFSILGNTEAIGPYRYDGTHLYQLEFPKHFRETELNKQRINAPYSPYLVYRIYEDRKGAMWFGTGEFGVCRFDGKSVKWMYENDLTNTPRGGSFGIRSIYEDQEGFFWMCNTSQRFLFDEDKTAKSDRLEYTKTAGIGDATTFGGDDQIYYSHIVEDAQGTIWLTTWDQGVFAYDGKNITHYPVMDDSKKVQLISMYRDRQDNLWLGTPENGVFKYNGARFERFDP